MAKLLKHQVIWWRSKRETITYPILCIPRTSSKFFKKKPLNLMRLFRLTPWRYTSSFDASNVRILNKDIEGELETTQLTIYDSLNEWMIDWYWLKQEFGYWIQVDTFDIVFAFVSFATKRCLRKWARTLWGIFLIWCWDGIRRCGSDDGFVIV